MSDAAHVDPDAVVRLGVDLNGYVRLGSDVIAAASSAASTVLREIDTELGRRRFELQGAENAYSACMRNDDADCGAERRALDRARKRVEIAQMCLRQFQVAKEHYDGASARYRSSVAQVNDQAQRRLAQIASDLGIYQQFSMRTVSGGGHTVSFGGGGGRGSTGFGGSGGSSGGVGGWNSPSVGVQSSPGIPDGYGLVPLASINDSDSRVAGPADFKLDCPPEDLEWGFSALQQVVLPALALGKDIDYFRDRDAREGRMGNRSYTETYSGFFGATEAPRFARQSDGTLHVANGFHRVWVAKSLGLEFIPGQVID